MEMCGYAELKHIVQPFINYSQWKRIYARRVLYWFLPDSKVYPSSLKRNIFRILRLERFFAKAISEQQIFLSNKSMGKSSNGLLFLFFLISFLAVNFVGQS